LHVIFPTPGAGRPATAQKGEGQKRQEAEVTNPGTPCPRKRIARISRISEKRKQKEAKKKERMYYDYDVLHEEEEPLHPLSEQVFY